MAMGTRVPHHGAAPRVGVQQSPHVGTALLCPSCSSCFAKCWAATGVPALDLDF